MVNTWYRSIKLNLQHDEVIDFSNLNYSHSIFRCINVVEFRSAINHMADKAPGKDGIRIKQIKALPLNYIKGIINVHNSSLASKYFPKLSKVTSMIFINKPSKAPKDPYGYHPISLLNILGKTLEKIIAQRYLHFLEYHNIQVDLQFGFRKGRSTQHPIFLQHNAIIHYSKNKSLRITATRDVQRAFDTVWWRGILYKLFHLPGDQLQFALLMYNYLSRRTVEPKFQGEIAPQFHCKAGVTQGSSLRPIL